MLIDLMTLPQRKERLRELLESANVSKMADHSMRFQGSTQSLPVFSVGINLPCYRLANGRTMSSQLEYIKKNSLAHDFFRVDPDSAQALAAQHNILLELIEEKNLLNTFKKVEQTEHMILTREGYIVNGNRRVCAMRKLLEEDDAKYDHFKFISVAILPPCSTEDIKELEGQLQVKHDIRANYTWVNEAMLYRDWRAQDWTDDQICALYDKTKSAMRELLAMLDEAEIYLEHINAEHEYSRVTKDRYAFKGLEKVKKKCKDSESDKQLIRRLAYLMIEDKESDEGRLHENIPSAYKYLGEIAESLKKELGESGANVAVEGIDVLGVGDETTNSDYSGLIHTLDNLQDNREALNVIQDTIEVMEDLNKEEDDAMFCFRRIEKAHTYLASAQASMDTDTVTEGIAETLTSIEAVIKKIMDQLPNDGN